MKPLCECLLNTKKHKSICILWLELWFHDNLNVNIHYTPKNKYTVTVIY